MNKKGYETGGKNSKMWRLL